ncbi:MAG: single-stranded DNA-binding protein [Corallococcus sp.]|nr:single-stranded DNA-binding protein [Corallococcus sp.]
MNTQRIDSNYVTLYGKVTTKPQFSHEVYGEKFYEVTLAVKRLSDIADYIPIVVSERLMSEGAFAENSEVAVEGQFRSYNKLVGEKSKLMLTVFVRDVLQSEADVNPNYIQLQGYVCKPPIFRTTPFSREIADILLAVNRQYNKSDYIPCIAWGRNARFAKTLAVGEHISIVGRVQSRQYQKRLDDETVETRTAYEVSVSKISVVEDAEENKCEDDDSETLRTLI